MDIVNSYFKQFYPEEINAEDFRFTTMLGGMKQFCPILPTEIDTIFPRMEMIDGFSMSVQGHFGAYSQPRDDFAEKYFTVEVGFPSNAEELLMSFADDSDNPTETVYGYVPISIIEEIIAKHGGLVNKIKEKE
jgi:hypothetical protein